MTAKKSKLDNEVKNQSVAHSQQAIEDILTCLDAFLTEEIRTLQTKRRALKEFSSNALLDAWFRLNVKSINRKEVIKSFTELILAESH